MIYCKKCGLSIPELNESARSLIIRNKIEDRIICDRCLDGEREKVNIIVSEIVDKLKRSGNLHA